MPGAGQTFKAAATRGYSRKVTHGQVAVEQNEDRDNDDFQGGHCNNFLG
jgi:hypothetical protein